MKSQPSKQRILYLRIFVAAIIMTVAAGWILTGFPGQVAEKEFKEKVEREANLFGSLLKGGKDNIFIRGETLK